MKKNRYIALLAGLSLALMSSPALAYPSADTVLVSGYDVEAGVVLYGVSSIDQEGTDDLSLDCSLDGEHTYVLGDDDLDEEDDFETREVTDLFQNAEGDVTFGHEDVNTDGDYDEDLEAVYGSEEAAECGLTAVTIEHPGDGEINHGTIVSTFARLLQGGNGCLIRLFAQSDYGKADYVDDGDAEALTAMLSSQETACKKGPSAAVQAEGDDDESRGGPPPWAGPKQDRAEDAEKPGKGNRPAHAGAKGDDSGS